MPQLTAVKDAMNRKVKIVTSISNQKALTRLPDIVDLVEVRGDLMELSTLKRELTDKPLIYVLRSKEEGGTFAGSPNDRTKKLLNAVKAFDFIELEGERDLIPEILDHVPVEKRRIAWYGYYEDYQTLKLRLEKYIQVKASLYKLVVHAKSHKETIAATRLIQSFEDSPVLSYAIGPFSKWSQVIAPFLGAPEVPSTINNETTDTLLYTPSQLNETFGLPHVYDLQNVFGIVGNPVANSISPNLHNEAYRKLNLPYLYLPFHAEHFRDFMEESIGNTSFPISISGLTVVSPFKRDGYAFSDQINAKGCLIAKVCNGLVKIENNWKSFSTDASGALEALSNVENWDRKRIAIVGIGGTGQTIATALEKLNVSVTLVNRTIENAKRTANVLGLPFLPLHEFKPRFFDIIIHTTPLGKNRGEIPFDLTQLTHTNLVIDHVYPKQDKTELVKHCELFNIKVIDGKDIARMQIKKQFKAMTGIKYPENLAIEELYKLKVN